MMFAYNFIGLADSVSGISFPVETIQSVVYSSVGYGYILRSDDPESELLSERLPLRNIEPKSAE